MHPDKRALAWINLLGGTAVLASYGVGLWANPAIRGDLWGDVPQEIRPAYTVSMVLGAVGYLAFTSFLLFRTDPNTVRIGGRFGLRVVNVLYVMILVPSALWMPLTFAMLKQPSEPLWWAIRVTLATVGLGAVGLFGALVGLRPRQPALAYGLAVAGTLAFCFQTAFLDAVVWPAFFPG
jgi:hypothetical protein